MKEIKLVVLEMAGTIIEDDRYVHRALITALQAFGFKIKEEEANQVMGMPKPVAIRQLLELKLNNSLKISESWIYEIHKRFVLDMTAFYQFSAELKEKEGLRETLLALRKQNIKIAIDTGFDRQIAQTIINRLGWEKEQLIDFSITSDEVVNGRPFPDMIFRAMELAGVQNADQVAKVGDTVSDIRQGFNAGCGLVIGVSTGAFSSQELAAESPTHLIEGLPELLPLLQPLQVS